MISSLKSLLFFSQLHSEVEKPLLTFRSDHFKKDLKKYDHHIADLRKQLASRYAGVEKVRRAGGAAEKLLALSFFFFSFLPSLPPVQLEA